MATVTPLLPGCCAVCGSETHAGKPQKSTFFLTPENSRGFRIGGSKLRGPLPWVLACLLVFLCIMAPHRAVASVLSRVALVVGVSDYPGGLKLANPVNDANSISSALKELNFEVITVLDPNRPEFIDALQRFERNMTGTEAALFYYSGHAIQLRGVNYLLPKEGPLRS